MKGILDKADPKTHEMSMRDLIPLFEAAAKTKGIVLGPCVEKEFWGLSRHPSITEDGSLRGKSLKVNTNPQWYP